MGSGCITSFSKRYISRFSSSSSSEAPLLADLTHSLFLTVHRQRFPRWVRAFHQQCRTRDPRISNFSFPSRSFSTSSSNPNTGFLGWYLGMLKSRPIITKGISSSLIFSASDLTSQMITLPSSSSFDKVRTLRMAAYGLLILGPVQHLWFSFISNVLPKRDILSTLKKLLMGQMIYGPVMNSVFFSFNAALQGEGGAEIIARLKRDLPRILMNGLLYWPACDFVTFKYVPAHLQPLANNSCAYIWTIYLSYMANLKGVSGD